MKPKKQQKKKQKAIYRGRAAMRFNSIRRYGAAYDSRQVYTHRPGAYAVLIRHGRILLTWQGLSPPEIQLPGGGQDAGENLLQTLKREVYEETGWHFRYQCKLGTYRRFTYIAEYDLWAEKICHIYLGMPTIKARPRPIAGDHLPFWACPVAALDMLSSAADAAVLREYLVRMRRYRL